MGIVGGPEIRSFVEGDTFPEGMFVAINSVVEEFEGFVRQTSEALDLRRAVVRSQLVCNALLLVDNAHLWIIAEPAIGLPQRTYGYQPDLELTADRAQSIGVWDIGLRDPFTISLERKLLDQAQEERAPALGQVAEQWVDEEARRAVTLTQLISLEPLFGQPSFRQDPRLCFVIMPFAENLTEIYQTFVKPTVEAHNLACLRADDIRTNRAIMDNIWKSICEARLILADLTTGNANVFYELGIAHTVGKETILISQREEHRRPFDVLHLRTIIYEDTAIGGEKLREALHQSVAEVLDPIIIP